MASYVTLKIMTNDPMERSAVDTELEMSRCIALTEPKSKGLWYLRTVLDWVELRESE